MAVRREAPGGAADVTLSGLELDDSSSEADDRRVRPVVGVQFRKNATTPSEAQQQTVEALKQRVHSSASRRDVPEDEIRARSDAGRSFTIGSNRGGSSSPVVRPGSRDRGSQKVRDNRRSAWSRTARPSSPSLNRFHAVRATASESMIYAANRRPRADAARGMVLATTYEESANDCGARNLEGSTGCHA
jgi:hypothetical protein